ncbi:hypothetical protein SAMN05660420_00831 [Desulfuromusa kysingii]|uniref:Uncharacterized protein n=1 Tax=Desulfuromusa kysingii TaxID=37625 RepID=A0A1H3X5B6_9BACT|nr:hypothetical protein [Desulfuromusa kysingii]SDZ94596.1 hypothetical protein SAMN05660420_00831 [Desulfuromusa kysingii]
MPLEPRISLACPYCDELIYETLSWFKQPYFNCPACDNGLAAGQFTSVIRELEHAMDARVEEIINDAPHTSCCGKKSCCH